MIEYSYQPLGIRRGVRLARPARRRFVPGSVRQEEVDGRGPEGEKSLIGADWVVAKVDGAEQSAVQVHELRLPQSAQPLGHGGVTAAPAGEAAVLVVRLL